MNTGHPPTAAVANQAWSHLVLLLAPDVADADNTRPALGEAQFAALSRVHSLARSRRTSGVSGDSTARGRSTVGPCADR
jgi:hypothetical protein